MRVDAIMTEDPAWVDESTSLGEAVCKLDESRVRHLPVLRDGSVVGMLSERDVREELVGVSDSPVLTED
jgi:acetoin utilization protein AcuB